MHLFDWGLVMTALLLIIAVGLYTRQFVTSVADFMAAGRVAKRYLLAVGRAEMQAGVVVYVANFEIINHSGFSYVWWTWLPQPILLIFTILGFVIYRYRETRAMTLGQFFELRYSRNLRLFAGFLGFFAGLLNFGIIPGIGARVMVYFLGLPPDVHYGGLTVPTYIPLMAVFLVLNLFLTLSGGIITIIMTNCVEGIISQILYLVIIFGLLSMFHWTQISATLGDQPAGRSFLNPLDSFQTKDFNIWLVLMGILGSIYGTMAWQNQSAYNAAPLTAHEGVMGNLLGQWRGLGQGAVITLLAICAMTYLHDPAYASEANQVNAELAKISNAQTQEQLEIPITITHILPTGMRGALCTILLLGLLGGDSGHLHSWGSLFIQDVVLPLRGRPFTPKQHVRLLRWSIAGVALFVFLFGIYFPLVDYISMWWTVTMCIYVSGAGSVIIGGLYWKKATTTGAWSGFLTGFTLSIIGIIIQEIYGKHFPLNLAQISFVVTLVTIATFGIVSLWTCQEDFDMDRMLHRGRFGLNGDLARTGIDVRAERQSIWTRIIGFDGEFTRGDKWIAAGLFGWMMVFFSLTVLGSVWYLIRPWPIAYWSNFWHVTAVLIPVAMSGITCIWFTWGGILDAIDFFRRLRSERINPLDDGLVIQHRNLDEASIPHLMLPEEDESTPIKN